MRYCLEHFHNTIIKLLPPTSGFVDAGLSCFAICALVCILSKRELFGEDSPSTESQKSVGDVKSTTSARKGARNSVDLRNRMSPVLMGKAESCGERAAMVEGGERVMVDGDEREVEGCWERERAAVSVEVVAPVSEKMQFG